MGVVLTGQTHRGHDVLRVSIDDLAERVRAYAQPDRRRPLLVAIDGGSAAGKTTLAARLAAALDAAVVHTDDLAWHEPLFAWTPLLIDVLTALRAGEGVRFVPPAWTARGRDGAIEVAPDVHVVLVEGVGSSAEPASGLYDVRLWVSSDAAEAERRGLQRDIASGENGDAAQSTAFWHTWMAAERAHFDADRPWQRADLVVNGTPAEPLPDGTYLLSTPSR